MGSVCRAGEEEEEGQERCMENMKKIYKQIQ